MATDNTSRSGRFGRTVRGVVSTVFRLALDLFVVTVWVVFLTLAFLEIAWPRWAFYALLVVGVGGYVTVTSTWGRSDAGDGSDSS